MSFRFNRKVWKNTEDELIKAAVMKYGLNQWSRISSLLPHRSPDQCKARWYEWLDPSIKKTEWTREEEEKLLHLCRIFPQQWRTIAPIVGRTPAQCVDHYERLLSQARGEEQPEDNDPRRLRPGEIDSNLETRPAKPDPIDMDQEDLEMLAEARARLANFQGKKAKRLQRNKETEASRRMSMIQKRRELKAAGIDYDVKKVRVMDYNKEVPFERRAVEMAYVTGEEEDPEPGLKVSDISLKALEGKRRDEEEGRRRKQDEKTVKRLKNLDLPKVVSKMTEKNTIKANLKLVLPTPQLSDKEIEEMVNVNSKYHGSDKGSATDFLVGNYSSRAMTSRQIRTPKIENPILREARDNIALLHTQTPLVGGENAVVGGSDFVLISKRASQAMDQVRSSQRRDALGISLEGVRDQNWEVISQTEDVVKDMIGRDRAQDIKSSLGGLPKPKNEYEIEIGNSDVLRNVGLDAKKCLDAEDQDALNERHDRERLKKKKRLMSQAVRKDLPRPYKPNRQLVESYLVKVPKEAELRREAEILLAEEMLRMVEEDERLANQDGQDEELLSEEELEEAERLLKEEMLVVKRMLKLEEPSNDTLELIREENKKNVVFDDNKQMFVDGSNGAAEEGACCFAKASLEIESEKVNQEIERIKDVQEKLQSEYYAGKAGEMQQNLAKNLLDVENYQLQKEVYSELYGQEQKAISARVKELEKLYEQLKEKERKQQEKHAKLLREKDNAMQEAPTIGFI